MNSAAKTVAITAVLGGLMYGIGKFFSQGRALVTLIFSPGRVQSLKWQGLSPIITMILIIQNTSSKRIVIQSLAAKLFSKDGYTNTYIGNVGSFTTTYIEPNTELELELKITLQAISAVNELFKAFENGNFSKDIILDGYVNVDDFQLPFKITYSLGI